MNRVSAVLITQDTGRQGNDNVICRKSDIVSMIQGFRLTLGKEGEEFLVGCKIRSEILIVFVGRISGENSERIVSVKSCDLDIVFRVHKEVPVLNEFGCVAEH